MTVRIESLDDFDVRWKYEQEGWTQREIANYYGVSQMTIYFRLHLEKQKEHSEKYREKHREEAKEASRIFRLEHPEYDKEWHLEHPEYSKDYYDKNKTAILEQKKQRNLEHPEFKKQWRLEHPEWFKDWRRYTEKGRASVIKNNANRRQLGSIELNKPFPGSEGHHIDEEHIIYIPKELHKSIWHNVKTGKGMEEINAIAFQYITEEMFDNLIAGEI